MTVSRTPSCADRPWITPLDTATDVLGLVWMDLVSLQDDGIVPESHDMRYQGLRFVLDIFQKLHDCGRSVCQGNKNASMTTSESIARSKPTSNLYMSLLEAACQLMSTFSRGERSLLVTRTLLLAEAGGSMHA